MDHDSMEVDLFRDDRFMRQLGILHPAMLEGVDVTLIGAGGIGSFVGETLARMGVGNITVYDDDTVEDHNVPNQAYPESSIGQSKAKALAYLVAAQVGEGTKVNTEEKRVGDDANLSGIVISGVDSMEDRRIIWESVKRNKDKIPLYIEARMGAEMLRIQAFDPSDEKAVKEYEGPASMYSDDEATMDPCTARAIVYNGTMAASLIANVVKRHVVGEVVPKEIIFDFTTLEVPSAGMIVSP